MMHEKVLYTDGHEVTVTDSFFKVKKSLYQLNGITKYRLFIIHPDRLIPFILLVFGAMLITMGALQLIPSSSIPDFELLSIKMNANVVALGLGGGLLFAGSVAMGLIKDRYAIRIGTAEGEKNVVVSPKKEYIAQIQDALNHAFFNLVSSPRKSTKTH